MTEIKKKNEELYVLANKIVKNSKVVILGLTFKENTPDIRNSKVFDIIENLKEYEINPIIVDPLANKEEAELVYGIKLTDFEDINEVDCLVLAVNHDIYINKPFEDFEKMFKKIDGEENIIIDIKSILNKDRVLEKGYHYWSL